MQSDDGDAEGPYGLWESPCTSGAEDADGGEEDSESEYSQVDGSMLGADDWEMLEEHPEQTSRSSLDHDMHIEVVATPESPDDPNGLWRLAPQMVVEEPSFFRTGPHSGAAGRHPDAQGVMKVNYTEIADNSDDAMNRLEAAVRGHKFKGSHTRTNITKAPRDAQGYLKEAVLSDVVRSGEVFEAVRPSLPNFPFTMVALNKNIACEPHRDRNGGPSAIVYFGRGTGGALHFEDGRSFEARRHWHFYDGNDLHWNGPTSGEKFAVVAYAKPKEMKETEHIKESKSFSPSTVIDAAPSAENVLDKELKNKKDPKKMVEKKTYVILYLWCGPKRPGSFEEHVTSIASKLNVTITVEGHDLLQVVSSNLCDDHVWRQIITKAKNGYYDALIHAPPCETCCNLLGTDGFNEALRSPEGPGRYGLSKLQPEQVERVRQGTLMAVRAAEISTLFVEKTLPWLHEQPHHHEDKTHMHKLDEWQVVLKIPEVKVKTVHQCAWDTDYLKETDLVYYFPNSEASL